MAGVNVKIGADASQFEAEVSRARRQVSQLGSEMREGVTTIAKWGAAAGAAAAGGLTALAVKGSRAVTQQERLAKALGTTNKQVAGITSAFRAYGLQTDDVSDAINTLSDRALDASSGMQSFADDFKLVGMNVDDLKNKQPVELFRSFANSISQVEDPQRRVAAAVRIFGDDIGRKLLPLLMQGGDALDQFATRADELGLAVSSVESEQVERAQIAMGKLAEIGEAVASQFSVQLAPVIEAVAERFELAAREAGGMEELVESGFNDMVDSAGFVADAVEGIRRTFLVAGKGAAMFTLQIREDMIEAAEAVVSGPIDALNSLIRLANNVPGVDLGEIQQFDIVGDMQQQLTDARAAVDIASQDIQDTLNEPMPSTMIDKFVEDANRESKAAAEAVNKNLDTIEPIDITGSRTGGGGGEGKGGQEDPNKQLQKDLQRIREANMSEVQLLKQKHAREREVINEAKEKELELKGSWDELEREMKARHEKELSEIEKKSSKKRKDVKTEEERSKFNVMNQTLGNMSSLMNTENKKMFQIGKAASLAQASINAYEAITGAYKVGANIGGPPLGAAYAAAAGAAQFATISRIRSQSFNGGGGGGGSSSGGSGGGGGASGSSQASQQDQSRNLNVSLQGFDPNSLYTGDQVGGLLDALSDEAKDRGLNLMVRT